MVDVDTALKASAYSGKKRSKEDGSKERVSKTLEPFDPAAAFEKEKADAWSMWLVISLAATFALFQRYVILPSMDGPARSIWLLPLSIVFFLPSIHRLFVPSRFSELYTGGNWFRAGMLFLFTWLAASVAMINPPMGDIASPEVPEGLGIAANDDVSAVDVTDDGLILSVVDDTPEIILGFSVRDNWKLDDVHLNATIQRFNDEEVVLADWDLGGTEASAAATQYELVSNWTAPGEPSSKADDFGLAFELEGLEAGIHTISIRLTEDGDPWKNTWSKVYTLNVQIQ
ncbi:MAG TPA: hypothetical protein HA247_01090 [Candidatus Thalassarchaeaceae archaeon]|nr:MAG TPA: hypothetical protein D7H98_01105 [Candidatus Poseidoniales archaeon]HII89591.1 hypothetical protein [Candidatus Thalassarchaeaceae archaeon]